MIRLSYSRISTLLTCSYSYFQSYFLKGPRGTSVPTSIGNATHYVLECLAKDRRKKYGKQILEAKTSYCIPSIERLVKIHCRKFGILTEENLGKIDSYILIALKNDLYSEGAIEVEHEKEFDIKTDRIHIYGFIDHLSRYKDKITVRDFKTGAHKPKKEDIPIQALLYELVQKIQHPDLKREIEFHYLQFPRATVVKHEQSDDAKLDGFVEWLAHISEYMEKFTPEQAYSNMGKTNGNHNLCGKLGTKPNGEPKHVCQWKYPNLYYSLYDEKGKFVASSFDKKELDKKLNGGRIEMITYPGCPAWKHEWESK